MRSGKISSVLVVHATPALLDRMPTTRATSDDVSTTALGAWYATRLPWRRAAVLLVNHTTLHPLLMPLAPAATLLARVPEAIAELLHHHHHHHHAPADLIATEQTAMTGESEGHSGRFCCAGCGPPERGRLAAKPLISGRDTVLGTHRLALLKRRDWLADLAARDSNCRE
jgi:hypothetical protein